MSQKSESSPSENTLEGANSTFSEYIEFFRDFVVILIIVILMRVFLVTPFQINGQSMEPSYHNREFILVNKFSYLNFANDLTEYTDDNTIGWFAKLWQKIPVHIWDPIRGDVVVIKPHVDKNREYYIKRVIAVPGDVIRFQDGQVYIKTPKSEKFVEINEPYLSATNKGRTQLPDTVEANQFTVPDNAYWVMGDNRNNSADSRSCFYNCVGMETAAHFIKRSDIVGKVLADFGYFHIFKDKSWSIDTGNIGWDPAPRLFSSPSTAKYPELGE